MLILEQHTVPTGVPKTRLLDYALQVIKTVPSRSAIKKIIRREELLIDGIPGNSGSWVIANQQISLIDLELKPPKALDIKLDIIFEDEHIAIINKPAGIEVSGNKYYTIQNALVAKIKHSSEPDALKWARPVHRLDMPTSGLLLIAKTASAIMKLGQQLEKHEIQKKYSAIVAGNLPNSGEINTPINNQNALSSYKPVARCHSLKMQWLSLVKLTPHTGRTHQLRIHMAELGFPIVGDRQYGKGPLLKGKGLFLAAVELIFVHPYNNKPITVTINHPKKFNALMEREERRWMRYTKDATKHGE
jgi:RluA family pseudouridine synthase